MKSNKTMLIFATIVTGCFLLAVSSTQAGTYAWTNNGGDNAWDNTANWDTTDGNGGWEEATQLPSWDSGSDTAIINKGGTTSADSLDIDGSTGTVTPGTDPERIVWKYLFGQAEHWDYRVDWESFEDAGYLPKPDAEDSRLNLSGTAHLEVGQDFHLGGGGRTDTVNQSGGTLDVIGSDGMYVGMLENSRGEYEISGGTLNTNTITLPHTGVTYKPYKTTLDAMKGTGEFSVVGSGGTINVGDGELLIGDGGTLKFRIDGTGVSPIQLDGSGPFSIEAGAILDVGLLDGVTASEGDSFDLVTWTHDNVVGMDNLSLSDPDTWEMGWATDNSGTLSVTYIPEPSSLVLLGLAGLLLMKRRRL